MSKKFAPIAGTKNESTGRFHTALCGPYKGRVGEEVAYLQWGGLNLEFSDGQIITFALSDVEVKE